MIEIDRSRLQTDLKYRVAFIRDFIEFTEDDAKVLRSTAPIVLPVVMTIVDGVYDHLFNWSYTKQTFLKRNLGYEGEVAEDLDSLTIDSPQMKLRKRMMTVWTAKILTADYGDDEIWEYMDRVGIMHTGMPGFKHRVNKDPLIVDLAPIALTLGWISDIMMSIVMEFPREVISTRRKTLVLRAFNKVMWIQNDLLARHYTRNDAEAAANLVLVKAAQASSDEAKKKEAEMEEAMRTATIAEPAEVKKVVADRA